MKTIHLTSGPRGAGKSTYVALAKSRDPTIIVLDRDKFYTEKFGDCNFDPDTGVHIYAKDLFKKHIIETIAKSKTNSKIVIDAWNGFSNDRNWYIRILRGLDVDVIICLYFVTPLKECIEWFFKKQSASLFLQENIVWDYNLYHKEAYDIRDPKKSHATSNYHFDRVEKINPLQLSLPNVSIL